jgi:CRISPR-associated endonuclease/helicase Cas3
LIYALPLRTLAQGIYRQALATAETLGLSSDSQRDSRGREVLPPFVTLQTGEHPDDPFFDRGRIIVTTYDQVLSGLLDGPYGLSDRLHNVNAAAIAGSLVVFDEFHLMEPQRALLTAVAGLHLFRAVCQSVWMTATATQPLENLLREALDAEPVPSTADENHEMLTALPSVTRVTRQVVQHTEPISAEHVLRVHEKRSIVIMNTVGRAQEMFGQLRDRMIDGKDIKLILLHSRFFNGDRSAKEREVSRLFGKKAEGDAILVATQVVEAGLDISCEHLHTELCPMNALIQRAGRCARFEGEAGSVHIYPLPPDNRAWLPYGDNAHELITVTKTRSLLQEITQERGTALDPNRAAEWVQAVHGEEDARALREGWRARLYESLRRIHQNAILRDPKRISDLIRGDDKDQVRVIISTLNNRPDSPGKRESVALSRWSLLRLFRDGSEATGWFWDGTEDEPWKPLRAVADLRLTYAVCLPPKVASYDSEFGLRLSRAGEKESPDRAEPERPGYAPLKREPWSTHALRVAEEAAKRIRRDGGDNGFVQQGLKQRYGLNAAEINTAVQACALLHDLGKLQNSWQRWAEAAQRAKDPSYQHTLALAHTDFEPEKSEDRLRERGLGIRRPAHAVAGAYYGSAFLADLLRVIPDDKKSEVAAACAAAILAHHGGWLTSGVDLAVCDLWPGWKDCFAQATALVVDEGALARLETYADKRGALDRLLGLVTGPESIGHWWPFVAYLTRMLRLSDQRATAEGAWNE